MKNNFFRKEGRCILQLQRRNTNLYNESNNFTKDKAGIGASQYGVTSLFLHPRRFYIPQNNDIMPLQRVIHFVKWKEIEGFPNHFISNTGVLRINKTVQKIRWTKNGYPTVILKYGKYYGITHIHKLVWIAFGDCEIKKGWEIHHKDENPANSQIGNLEYLPKYRHLLKHGRKAIRTPILSETG